MSDQMDYDDPAKGKLVESAYCRVWGRLKAFNNKRHVGAHVIRPITDYNEINYHLLEATAVHLFFTRGSPPAAGTNIQNGARTENGGLAQEGLGRQLPPVTPMARRLYKVLKDTPQSNEGLHAQMLATLLHTEVSEVHKAAEELVQPGIIFTTVDNDTWAILEY